MDFAYKNMIARNFIRLNHQQKCEILAVRNAESVRKFMLDSKIIGKSEHFRFIESLKEAKSVAYFGVYKNNSHEVNSSLGRANSACSDFLGSASPHSLQRTASASHSLVSHNPKNSSTILGFANGGESMGDSAKDSSDSIESLKDSSDSTKYSEKMDCHDLTSSSLAMTEKNAFAESSDSKTTMDCHDSATQNLAMTAKGDSIKSQKSSCYNSQLLGVVCFNHIDFANKNAFFGIYSIPDKKNGANLLAMLEFIAFEVLNLHALYAKVLSTNARALHFYAKHNFTHCGKMLDAIRRDGGFLDIEILAKFNARERI